MCDDRIDELENRVEKLEEAVFSDSESSHDKRDKSLSIAEFIQNYDISSHKKKVQVFGYFLEKRENKDGFTSLDIESAYKRAKIKCPQNISDQITKSAARGYIMETGESEDGRKEWIMTQSGERRVESELRENNG